METFVLTLENRLVEIGYDEILITKEDIQSIYQSDNRNLIFNNIVQEKIQIGARQWVAPKGSKVFDAFLLQDEYLQFDFETFDNHLKQMELV